MLRLPTRLADVETSEPVSPFIASKGLEAIKQACRPPVQGQMELETSIVACQHTQSAQVSLSSPSLEPTGVQASRQRIQIEQPA